MIKLTASQTLTVVKVFLALSMGSGVTQALILSDLNFIKGLQMIDYQPGHREHFVAHHHQIWIQSVKSDG